MSFCGLIKGISLKICILHVHVIVKINKRLFETFCVWIFFFDAFGSCFRLLAVIFASDVLFYNHFWDFRLFVWCYFCLFCFFLKILMDLILKSDRSHGILVEHCHCVDASSRAITHLWSVWSVIHMSYKYTDWLRQHPDQKQFMTSSQGPLHNVNKIAVT